MTGLLALVGGREHTPGCEPIDHAVLEGAARVRPVVAILPLASSRRTHERTTARAVAWWEGLGARPRVVPGDPEAAAGALDDADVLVLTGGVPDRLHRRLAGTSLGALVIARWQRGAALVGSSSGAMVLGAYRQSVRPPFAVTPGFGLLPHVAVAPHHELDVPRAVAAVRGLTHPFATIVGIDEATALVGRSGAFVVRGVGRVTVRRGTTVQTWWPGQLVRDLAPTRCPGDHLGRVRELAPGPVPRGRTTLDPATAIN